MIAVKMVLVGFFLGGRQRTNLGGAAPLQAPYVYVPGICDSRPGNIVPPASRTASRTGCTRCRS